MSTLTVSTRRTAAGLSLSLLFATLALSACGNKGPLVMPDKPAADGTVAPADGVTPEPVPATPAIGETASPLPPSAPPPAADPVLNSTDDDGSDR